MKNNEKRFIPGTDPEWGRELPDGYDNSLVDKAGNAWDNGFNFDEKDYEKSTFDNLAEETEFDPEKAKELKKQQAEKEAGA